MQFCGFGKFQMPIHCCLCGVRFCGINLQILRVWFVRAVEKRNFGFAGQQIRFAISAHFGHGIHDQHLLICTRIEVILVVLLFPPRLLPRFYPSTDDKTCMHVGQS